MKHPNSFWTVLNEAYARLSGYFWIQCPRCGDHYGGQQNKRRNELLKKHGCGTVGIKTKHPAVTKGVCYECTRALIKENPGKEDIRIDPPIENLTP